MKRVATVVILATLSFMVGLLITAQVQGQRPPVVEVERQTTPSAQIQPLLVNLNQRVPVSVTLFLPLEDGTVQTTTVPLELDVNLQIGIADTITAEIDVTTPTPEPTVEVATATPDPAGKLLFADDFETGISPVWEIIGEGIVAANGNLSMDNDASLRTGIVGDDSWQNYRVSLHDYNQDDDTSFWLRTRMKDEDNYMLFACLDEQWPNVGCAWYKVINGESERIPGTYFQRKHKNIRGYTMELEMQGNVYRTLVNNERLSYFVDDEYSEGGIALQVKNWFRLGGLEVAPLPAPDTD